MGYNKLIYQLLWLALSVSLGFARNSPCGEDAVGVGTYQRFIKKDGQFGPQTTQMSAVYSSECIIISKTDTTRCNGGWDQGVSVDCGNSYIPETVTTKNALYDCEDNIHQDIDTGTLCDDHTDELIVATWVQNCCKRRIISAENSPNSPDPVSGDGNTVIDDYTINQRRRK